MMNNTCTICGVSKPLEEFRTRASGLVYHQCRACERTYIKQYNSTDKRKNELYDLNRTSEARFMRSKSSAKSKGAVFSLTFDEYVAKISEPCYYCNFELGSPVECAIGLDRLNNNEGYIAGNVVSCCWTCNVLRSDIFTPEETKVAVKAILNVRRINNGC